MIWRAWCVGGVVEGTTREEWGAVRSVICVASRLGVDAHGRVLGRFAQGGDWFWWAEDGITCGATHVADGQRIDYDGPPDGARDAQHGVYVSDAEYARASREMVEWLNG